jgi:ABC-type multidrug transport system fused ATPase/permease subunit
MILKNISFEVESNKVLALVGHSGCGKSTCISMIERFYDPINGQVLFSGRDIREIDPVWYK